MVNAKENEVLTDCEIAQKLQIPNEYILNISFELNYHLNVFRLKKLLNNFSSAL